MYNDISLLLESKCFNQISENTFKRTLLKNAFNEIVIVLNNPIEVQIIDEEFSINDNETFSSIEELKQFLNTI